MKRFFVDSGKMESSTRESRNEEGGVEASAFAVSFPIHESLYCSGASSDSFSNDFAESVGLGWAMTYSSRKDATDRK
jgi:hypothetical protein